MKPQHCPVGRQQHGQASVWFLATLAACCCVFALVYNVGQVANQKEATVNAADAAALSGALVEARMLNFEAYTNRAMIANEVTIAQLVSLDSWVQYDYEFTQWVANYTDIIPYVDDILSSIADAANEADQVVNTAVPGLITGIEAVNTELWAAREAANLSGPVAANDIAARIANANETTFGNRYDEQPQQVSSFVPVVLALNEYNWNSFTDPYSDDNRGNAKSVILDSRDPFSTNRGSGTVLTVLNDALEGTGLASTLGTAYFDLSKTSGTTTLQDYNHWAAQDSLDWAVGSIKFCFVVIPCGYNTNVIPDGPPLAYGRADADSNGSTGINLCNYKPTTTNCTLAVENANHIDWNGPEPNGNGIPNIRDLAQGLSRTDPCSTSNGSDSPSLSFVTAVQKAGKATETTQRLGMNTVDVPGPQGSPQLTDNMQNGDALTSISAACTFFLRPDLNRKDITQGSLARADGVHEYASLYNPYWQARLTKPDPGWTTTLYALIGQAGLNIATP